MIIRILEFLVVTAVLLPVSLHAQMLPIQALHRQIAAVAPVISVSIADPIDKTTWVIQYDPTAKMTAEQSTAINAILKNFDFNAANTLYQNAVVARDKLAAGVTVSSASNSALSGSYSVDEATQAKIASVTIYVSTNAKFPAGLSQLPWADLSGKPHVFGTTAQFQAFAGAIADYVTQIILQEQQLSPVWPSAVLVIP